MTATTTTNPASTASKRRSKAATSDNPTSTLDNSSSAPDNNSTVATAVALAAHIPSSPSFPLPDLDAPAFSPLQPAVSYKLAFGDTSQFHCSTDGGKTTAPSSSAAIAGAVIDIALQISPAHNRDGNDYRLRLAFIEPSGLMAELNLNAVSIAADGSTYITSPARSLTGALLAITDADDDIRTFCEGARFSIRKGSGRGLFIETDIAVSGRWLAMSGALATLRVAKDPLHFCQQLSAIKERFRSIGLLLPGAAVLHTSDHAIPEHTGKTAALLSY